MIVGRALVERLEQTAALAGAAIAVEHSGSVVRTVGTGSVVLLGPGRYVNRAIGVTLGALDEDDLAELEALSNAADVPASLELCSWAAPSLLGRLADRSYHPNWFRDVFVRMPHASGSGGDDGVSIRPVGDKDADIAVWQQVLADGNEVDTPLARAISDDYAAAAHRVLGAVDLIAEVDGDVVGCGSLVAAGGVGWLGGAATAPRHRGRGVQSALLRHRLGLAGELGLDLVAATALPDGTSARNLRRHGFQLAYAQVVMTR